MREVLVVIPARGGSKGIPRKNVRLLAGIPLIAHAIRTSRAAQTVRRVVVTTDDEEIATIARRYGAEVIQRPPALAEDAVTLDPVVYHAVTTLEADQRYRPDIVVTVQPTSPLLRAQTINRAVELLRSGRFDTVISVVEDTHLFWTRNKAGQYVPMYESRLNRQFLPPMYRETGAILASRRQVITPESRIGPRVTLVELPPEEAVDIDTHFDWWMAEKSLARRRVVLRTDGSHQIGLGHVYRCLTLASRILDHEVTFVMSSDLTLGTSLVRQHHYSVVESKGDPLETIRRLSPDIVINDILDTTSDYVDALREMGAFVVNFEDLGAGAVRAHLVVNSLYDSPVPLPNHVWGPEYACLREEFYSAPTKRVQPEVRQVLLTFGGVDQGNLTIKVLRALDEVPGGFQVDVILGLGYTHSEELRTLRPGLRRPPRIHHNVRSMSEYIHKADLVITSAGRTVLEVAAIGTPCLVLAQNEREMRHLHARSENGVVNLGLGHQVPEAFLVATLRELVENVELRREMNRRLLALDVRGGCERVVELIISRYRAFEKERS
ncbi:MAG TPA: UDP-2,4-diacetamido-2,4,6-trideoxy-beta-L-altropyranose hydrolase [Anaerolineae bacterium]|nr:UDP-2,4-diacetamido-2,4,6-trideoxy-beta-L-altropyranose hydrolase [Anaerolineae bacterium]